MIKIIKGTTDSALTEAQTLLRKEEFREMSNWGSFPEKMLITFRSLLSQHASTYDELCFFDVGAAEGCYTCEALKHHDKVTVFSFEPEIPRMEVLQENILKVAKDNNKEKKKVNVNLYQLLVGDGKEKTQLLRLYEAPETGGGGGSSTTILFERHDRKSIDIPCKTVSLNDFVDKCSKVDVIKIDVEGAELNVLNGAEKFLEKFKPFIFLEVHNGCQFGSVTIKQVKKIVKKCNIDYQYKLIEKHGSLEYYLLYCDKG